jgi:hypothetical protein
MRYPLQLAVLTGATLLVAACGGGAANNTANASVDNGTVIGNDPMAPELNAGMPPADNGATNATTTTVAPGGNTTTTTTTSTTNTTNGM